jgi:hypothetical protein
MAVSVHDATPSSSGNSYTTSGDATVRCVDRCLITEQFTPEPRREWVSSSRASAM